MNIMNEYIETKVKGKIATKVDGSVYEHLGLSATILQGCIFQLFNYSDEYNQVYHLVQIYTPTVS